MNQPKLCPVSGVLVCMNINSIRTKASCSFGYGNKSVSGVRLGHNMLKPLLGLSYSCPNLSPYGGNVFKYTPHWLHYFCKPIKCLYSGKHYFI